jgi:hypothetical protein
MKRLLVLSALICASSLAQSPSGIYPPTGTAWYVGIMAIPASLTAVPVPNGKYGASPPSTVFVEQINLQNTTGSAVTVTIVDGSTNCNGGACSLVPAVSIAANTSYSINKNGEPANGGLKWSASSANAIHASVRGRY